MGTVVPPVIDPYNQPQGCCSASCLSPPPSRPTRAPMGLGATCHMSVTHCILNFGRSLDVSHLTEVTPCCRLHYGCISRSTCIWEGQKCSGSVTSSSARPHLSRWAGYISFSRTIWAGQKCHGSVISSSARPNPLVICWLGKTTLSSCLGLQLH